MDAVQTQRSPPLTQIPVELLLRITHYLTTSELSNVRLTCKPLERSLFNFFSHEFFRKRQFMISEHSLQALVDISRHQSLSPFLKHVIVATDFLHGASGSGTAEQIHRYHEAQASQLALLTTGTGRDMLAEAFKNLKNLEIVDLRDFNSPTRKRDGALWSSYGAPTVFRNTGSKPRMHIDVTFTRNSYASELFSIIVSALAASNARPPSLEVVLREQKWGLLDTAMTIPKFLEPSVVPVLHGLKKLHLTLDFERKGVIPMNSDGNAHDEDASGSCYTRSFLSHCPNVTWLRLNFRNQEYGWDSSVHTKNFLAWLGTPVVNSSSLPKSDGDGNGNSNGNPNLANPIPLSALEILDIGFLETEHATILRLVKKFAPTLHNLNIRKVTLDGKEQNPDGTPNKRQNLWAHLFTGLARMVRSGLELRAIEATQMSQRIRGHRHVLHWANPDAVFFEHQGDGHKEFGKKHTEPASMAQFLDRMASDVHVAYQYGDTEDEDEDDDDDDENDDDDMDGMDDDMDEDMDDGGDDDEDANASQEV